jgi:hypothetical protein
MLSSNIKNQTVKGGGVMARRRLNHFAESPQAKEAVALAKKVFNLKERLGISYERMAKESDLSVNTLQYIKTAWVNGTKDHDFMYVSIANALIDFWNRHLINGKSKPVKGNKDKVTEQDKNSHQSESNEDLIPILIEKVGFVKAQELLIARGKKEKLKIFLESLTPDELADLV